MGLFLLLSGGLTCAFFLYVLVQFERDLKRTEKRKSSDLGGGLQIHSRRLSGRGADSMNKKIGKILRKAVESGRGKRPARKLSHSEGIPYIETVFPIGFVVTPITKLSAAGRHGSPSKRIA